MKLIWKKLFVREEMDQAAKLILEKRDDIKIFLLKGNLGAGKTSLCTELVKALGHSGKVSSPTFGLVNVYSAQEGEEIFHLDLYRINNQAELTEAGILEALSGDNFCFIEWPEVVEQYIHHKHAIIELFHHPRGREIAFWMSE